MVYTLVSINFDSPPLGHTIKTNCKKLWTIDPKICSILTFLENGLGLMPPHFIYDFSTKMFHMLYSVYNINMYNLC